MSTYNIREATGATIRPENLLKNKFFPITDFGAAQSADATQNTVAINKAIAAAATEGGTVVFPKGTFYTYTIHLESNVNLYLEEGAIVAAAKTDILRSYEKQIGEGGNYEEPEVNPYLGLQDHGHSYFANSLVYGVDLENIMIYGKGLFTGGRFNTEIGILEYVLQGGDPAEPTSREMKGHRGEWFGNKGIALVRCKNIVFEDFSITIGGHFAIITEGCENLYVNRVLVDTTRDAFDIDCCKDVTVLNTTCNSLTDDGLCLKASFGAGIFMPIENVLIEDCIVSGYDAGSVYAGEYTRDKLIALDRCGPTGRVKFGTESTCGYHQVTIRRVKFDRSRGFCLEAVDCSSLTDVIFEDCTLDNISSAPIFLRAGDRGRFPVTGNSASEDYPASTDNIRLDNRNWVLPNTSAYHYYPIKRYAPHYNRTKTVTVDGYSTFEIVDTDNPVQNNPANYVERDGKYFLKAWEHSKEIPARDLPLYANGIGSEDLACVANVLIRNVTITNVDPRYPILLMGMTDSHLKNIVLENVSVEYRGGLSMEHAVEQRQLNTEWKFSQFHAKEHVQNIPWLVNTFFLKNEGLLPRADWNAANSSWKDNPYNVPELPEVYPESSNWGILPSYGLFVKHVDDLTLKNVKISYKVPDSRHVCVLDDVNGITVDGFEADCTENTEPFALITHHYRRHTNAENVPEQPYFTTEVQGLHFAKAPLVCNKQTGLTQELSILTPSETSPWIKEVEINAPAPGTPKDSLYAHPTVPCAETGYRYAVDTNDYPLPLTVYRPFIQQVAPISISVGEACDFTLTVRNPASDISAEADNGIIYNEQVFRKHHSVKGVDVPLTLCCENLPMGASFDAEKKHFIWTPDAAQQGTHEIVFTVDDGIIPEKMTVTITVKPHDDVDYDLLAAQLQAVTESERDTIANLSNASAILNMSLPDINWVGFYLVRDNQLVLGPFQGKPACIRIDFGKGVCGTAVQTDTTQLVTDVHQFPGHIACDSASNSELVIPLHHKGKIVGVLDIDSPLLARFSQRDKTGLEQFVKVLEEACHWEL